jgi:hypothetical protein
MPAPRPTRATGFLIGLATVMLVIAIGFGLFLLAGVVFGFGPNGHEVGVHTEVPTHRVARLPHGAVPPDTVNVLVRVPDASSTQLRWDSAKDLVVGVLFIAALWLLRQLLQSVRAGDPFTAANVGRLRTLALIVLAGVPIAIFLSSSIENAMADSLGVPGTSVSITMPFGAFAGGLGALVLAEVFAAGVRLREDVEGTI